MYKGIAIVLAVALAAVVIVSEGRSQSVPCWPVYNGVYSTIQCANGYWQTTTDDGITYTGNGTFDPNAAAVGAAITISPQTGGPQTNINHGPSVTPAKPMPLLAPHQAGQYGYPLPE